MPPFFHEQHFNPQQMEALRRAQSGGSGTPPQFNLGTRFGAPTEGRGGNFDLFLNAGGNPDAVPQTGFQFDIFQNGSRITPQQFNQFTAAPVQHTLNRPSLGFELLPGVDPSQFSIRGMGHGLDQLFQLGPQGFQTPQSSTFGALRPTTAQKPANPGPGISPRATQPSPTTNPFPIQPFGGAAPFVPDVPAPPDEPPTFPGGDPFGFGFPFPPGPRSPDRRSPAERIREDILRTLFPFFNPGGPGTPPFTGGENPATGGSGGFNPFGGFPQGTGGFNPLPPRPGEPQIDEAGRVALKGLNLDVMNLLGQLLQSQPELLGQAHGLQQSLLGSAGGLIPNPQLLQGAAASFFGESPFSSFLRGTDPLAQSVQGLINNDLVGNSVAQGGRLLGSAIPALEHILNQGLPGQQLISGGIHPGEQALRQLFDPSLPGSTVPGQVAGPVQFLNSIFRHGPPGQQSDISGREGLEGLQGVLTNLGRSSTQEAGNRLLGLGNSPPGIQNTVENSLQGLIQGGGLSPEFVRASQERILEPAQDQLVNRLNSLGGGFANLGTSGVAADALREQSSDFNNDLIRAGFQNLGQATGQGLQLGGQQFGQGFNVAQGLADIGRTGIAGAQGLSQTNMQNALGPISAFSNLTNSLTNQSLGRFGAVPGAIDPFLRQASALGMELGRFGPQVAQALQGLQFQPQLLQDQRMQQGFNDLLQMLGTAQGITGQAQNFGLDVTGQSLNPLLAFLNYDAQRAIANQGSRNANLASLGELLAGLFGGG